MKALKEKRVSLRSFLRRGLVILSLFALAFASCSDSGGDDTPTVAPTDPTAAPTGPSVTAVHILRHPTRESFQGARADLRGIAVEIIYSDGTKKYIRTNEQVEKYTDDGFFIEGADLWDNLVPDYCDEPFNHWIPTPAGATYKEVKLQYKGYNVLLDLQIPHIVPADDIDVYQLDLKDLYSDKRPEFSNPNYAVIVNQGWTGYNNGVKTPVAGAVPNPAQRIVQTMSDNYPHIDYSEADGKTLKVFVGTPNTGSYISKIIKVTNYHEAVDIVVVSKNWLLGGKYGIGYFDDDVDVFFSYSNIGNYSIDAVKVFNELRKSQVTFQVLYSDGQKSDEMTLDEFLDNSEWYYTQVGSGKAGGIPWNTYMRDQLVSSDGLKLAPEGGNTSMLAIGKKGDDYPGQWGLTLEYAPMAFNQKGTRVAEVDIDLYLWAESELVPKPIYSSYPVLDAIDGERAFDSNAKSEFELIKSRWQLIGSYESDAFPSQRTQSKPIELTKEIFYNGFYGASWAGMQANYYTYPTGGWTSLDKNLIVAPKYIMTQVPDTTGYYSYYNASQKFDLDYKLGTSSYLRNYPLPVYYRGQKLDGTELDPASNENIFVNLVGP